MQNYNAPDIVNIGTGEDIRIADLAALVADIVDFRGDIVYDADKPDGTPLKCLDVSKIKGMGWQAQIPLREGIAATYAWYLSRM